MKSGARPPKQTPNVSAHAYQPLSWRDDRPSHPRDPFAAEFDTFPNSDTDHGCEMQAGCPDARERSRLLRLLGLINYRILCGSKVYIEVGGTVYKTLSGLYWRSVFTGVEHYLLRCEEVSGGIWTEGSSAVDLVDLPIVNTRDGWSAQGHSLMFMLS